MDTKNTPARSKTDRQTGGTPEQTTLTVKLLGDDWIVENANGTSIGSADDRNSALELARQSAEAEHASSISILSADGTLEESVKI